METNFFSYFAGYIDGDGHFRFRKYLQDGYECFNCKIMITSTRKEPLEYFKTNIGGSFYAKAKKSNNWKQEYIYTLHVGKKVFSKIKPIENFLIEKRTQFKLIEKFLNGTSDERKSICEIAIKERDSFLAQIDIFNTLKAENKTRTPKISDFSYLAGYIDAEGCLTVTRKTLKETNSLSFSCHIRVSSTKYPCIQFLVNNFGGCIHYHRSKIKERSDCIQWEITDKTAEPILQNILPFLIIKKSQCEELLNLRKTFLNRVYPRDKNFRIYYNHFTPIRECIYSTVKTLNKRGL